MQIKGEKFLAFDDFVNTLVNHFDYSMKDIKEYNELTKEEQKIISEDFFKTYLRENNE